MATYVRHFIGTPHGAPIGRYAHPMVQLTLVLYAPPMVHLLGAHTYLYRMRFSRNSPRLAILGMCHRDPLVPRTSGGQDLRVR